jgi:hypothetical protein
VGGGELTGILLFFGAGDGGVSILKTLDFLPVYKEKETHVR